MTLFQNQFIVDDVSKIIKESIEQVIGGNAYQHVSLSSYLEMTVISYHDQYFQDKVNNWTGAVVENCLSVLTKQQKPYKYIGECTTTIHLPMTHSMKLPRVSVTFRNVPLMSC